MPTLGWGVLIAGLLAGLTVLLLYRVLNQRDQVHKPHETIYGVGFKRALLIYQPSNRGGNRLAAQILAEALAQAGYTVTVNHPSRRLEYDPMGYDLLIFGGAAYLGGLARPLIDYASRLKYTGRRVLLYVTGDMERTPELAAFRLCVPAGNRVRSIKIRPWEGKKLAEFATLKGAW